MLQAEKSGLHGVNSNSRRVGKEAQAASGSSRCSGRSLPQPGAPPGRPLAARSRAVMLPCPSSEHGLTYGREERRAVSGGQAPPRSAAAGSSRTPKPSARRLGLLPALPSPGPPLPVPGKPSEGARPGIGADGRPSQRGSRLPLFRLLPSRALTRCVAVCGVAVPLSAAGRGGGGGILHPTQAHPMALELPPPHSWDRDPAPAPLTRKGQHHGDPNTSREGWQAINPGRRRALVL